MNAHHLLIPCRARVPSLAELTDYLEGHGWVPIPPDPGGWDCWQPPGGGLHLEIPRRESLLWPGLCCSLLDVIATVEGRTAEDVARDLDLFERAP